MMAMTTKSSIKVKSPRFRSVGSMKARFIPKEGAVLWSLLRGNGAKSEVALIFFIGDPPFSFLEKTFAILS